LKALTFQDIRDVRVLEVAEPRLVDPGDVIVRVELAAICGSDLHPFRGHERGLDAGTVLGHEFMGEVVEVGASVMKWQRGDRVVAPFSTNCG
jgi:threonine dehydrogenase-like Zn-dependent dehydrogenase